MTFNQPVEREVRLISGKGLIKIPRDPLIRRCYITAFVARSPVSDYQNFKYNEPRSVYANLTFYKGDYVVREETMHYKKQRWDIIEDITGQSMYLSNCGFAAVQRSIGALATALGFDISFTPGEAFYPIDDYSQDIRVVCRDDTAIVFTIFTQRYDKCEDVPEPPPLEEPPEPPPFDAVPPGTPFNGEGGTPTITPPYDGEDDGGATIPFEGDETDPEEEEPPPIPECTPVTIRFSYSRLLDGQASIQSFSVPGLAPVDSAEIDEVANGGSSIFVTDRTGSGGSCSPTPVRRRVNRGLGQWSGLSYTVTPS